LFASRTILRSKGQSRDSWHLLETGYPLKGKSVNELPNIYRRILTESSNGIYDLHTNAHFHIHEVTTTDVASGPLVLIGNSEEKIKIS